MDDVVYTNGSNGMVALVGSEDKTTNWFLKDLLM